MVDITKHRTLLIQILKDIYSDITISSLLGFKGGTACYLFYELPRFSVDLDFDFIGNTDIAPVFEKIGKFLKEYGKIKEQYIKKNTIFFMLSYDDRARNVKVEISQRDFGSRYEIKNYLSVSMLVMKKEDIFAHKLVALLERKQIASRDLYDIWFFFKNRWEINKEMVEKRTGLGFDEYLRKCIDFIEEKFTQRNVLSGIGELLDEKQKVFVKNKLKNETIFLMKLHLNKK